MMHKAWSSIEEVPYCFFLVIRQISRSHGWQNCWFWPKFGISGLELQFEFTNGYEMMLKAISSIEEVPYCFSRLSVKFQGHAAKKMLILTKIGHFLTATPVWIHQWLLNDAQSLKWRRRGALFFFQSHPSNFQKSSIFDPNWAFPDCSPSLNSSMATKWCIKLEVA